MKNIFQNVYSISMDDLMGLWIDYFHSQGAVLVIWDCGAHFELLKRCGIEVRLVEGFNNKALTIEFPSIMDAFDMIDKIELEGLSPYMQVYLDGKLVSDNI
tara:strand:- start:18908 stop:19210 length:303 start_codon:yes stop_codon:yes gene_type:complete